MPDLDDFRCPICHIPWDETCARCHELPCCYQCSTERLCDRCTDEVYGEDQYEENP